MAHIKLWDNILDCPKVHRLSDRAFRVWIKALVTALRNGGRNGELPSLETMEFRMRMSAADIEGGLEELHRCGLIDPCPDNHIGGMPWRIHDWDEWQQSKDPTAAARQSRWREKQASRNALRNGVSDAQHNGVEEKKVEEKKDTTPTPPPPKGKRQRKSDLPKFDPTTFEPPAWVPRIEWNAWIELRAKKRVETTRLALEMAVADLEKFKSDGDDPAAVLRRSVVGGWTGVFPINDRNGRPAPPAKPAEKVDYITAESYRAKLME